MRLPGRKLFYTGVSENVRIYAIAVSANDAMNGNISADVRKHSSEKKLYNKNTAVYNEKKRIGREKMLCRHYLMP